MNIRAMERRLHDLEMEHASLKEALGVAQKEIGTVRFEHTEAYFHGTKDAWCARLKPQRYGTNATWLKQCQSKGEAVSLAEQVDKALRFALSQQ